MSEAKRAKMSIELVSIHVSEEVAHSSCTHAHPRTHARTCTREMLHVTPAFHVKWPLSVRVTEYQLFAWTTHCFTCRGKQRALATRCCPDAPSPRRGGPPHHSGLKHIPFFLVSGGLSTHSAVYMSCRRNLYTWHSAGLPIGYCPPGAVPPSFVETVLNISSIWCEAK